MISIIVAFDEKGGIGLNNNLPWKIKEDLKLFKDKTTNHKIIMGRKTFESIGKPLPNRENIVLTYNNSFTHTGITVYNDYKVLVDKYYDSEEEVFVIGGSSIYTQFIPYAKKLCISHVKGIHQTDTFFPEINYQKYNLVYSQDYHDFGYKEYQLKDEYTYKKETL